MITDTILLVDYQNVRDTGLKDLPAHRRLLLFVGKGQKPKADFVESAMKRGVRLDLVPIAEDGKNNLDFHLAFYLGRLLSEEPYGEFIIVSNDRDFEPLTLHLQSLGISCERRGTLKPAARAPAPAAKPLRQKPAAPKPAAAKAPPRKAPPPIAERNWEAEAVAFLKKAGKRQPKAKSALINSLVSHLQAEEQAVERIVEGLIRSGVIAISRTNKVTYF